MKVLVIAPHPDDEVLGCGGSILRHTSRGDEVRVVIVTKAIPELFSEEQVQAGRVEVRRAHEILGVSSTGFLDFPAPRMDMVAESEVALAISAEVRNFQPEVVYTPHLGDIHMDHIVAHRATAVACRPLAGTSVRRVLAYETLSETEWSIPAPGAAFAPNVFTDITPYLDGKVAAMKCYASQLREGDHPRTLEAISLLARLRGVSVGLPAAEAFMLLREVSPL
jgi:N-acetylglucosamine malate deacetylase 1